MGEGYLTVRADVYGVHRRASNRGGDARRRRGGSHGRRERDDTRGTTEPTSAPWSPTGWTGRPPPTALGVPASKVRTADPRAPARGGGARRGAGQQVPAELVMDGVVVKGVPGLLTLLHDGGYDDREMLTWLFTADDSLPGRPIDALRENRGAEVKRRAQALAL